MRNTKPVLIKDLKEKGWLIHNEKLVNVGPVTDKLILQFSKNGENWEGTVELRRVEQ